MNENRVINQIEEVGKLGSDRELGRLLNLLNDLLVEKSNLEYNQIEEVYHPVKQRFRLEYLRTSQVDLSNQERRIWHISLFSSLDYLSKTLDYSDLGPDEIVEKIENYLDDQFRTRIRDLSRRNDIEDLNQKLP